MPGINSNGLIVGTEIDANGNLHAAYWTSPSNAATLTAYPNDSSEFALSVNASGQIVGQAYINNTYLPIYWSSTSAAPTALAMPSLPGEVDLGIVNATINAKGQIIATIQLSGVNTPVYWSSPTATGQVLVLGGNTAGQVFDINSSGTIVGIGYPTGNTTQATLYINGQSYDLNTLIPAGSGWTLTSATSINDAGVIVGTGTLITNGTTQTLGFSITPK